MVIPVIHCFNDRYVPPAGVAFLSMLEHANPKHDYRLYVMHTDITSEHQSALTEIVRRFPNATLEFMDMKGAEVAASFRRLGVQGHYSAEVLYKLFIPSRFPQYDKVIVTDVDVLYRGDVSEEFVRFDVNSSDYVAGVGGEMGEQHFKRKDREYAASFNAEERERLFCVGGGYLFYNLAKMRADGIEEKFADCLKKEAHRLRQAEQDVINLCCWPHIRRMRRGVMACTFLWQITTEEEKKKLQPELDNAVQVHFASASKPWNDSSCLFLEEWFSYLMRTPFLREVLHGGFDYTGKWVGTLFGIPVLRRKVTTVRTTMRLFGLLPLREKRIG